MTDEYTQLNSQSSLVVPNGFIKSEAAGGGDCFFDSVAQGMIELCIDGGPFDVKVLRQACFNYADCNHSCVYDCRSRKTWRQAIEQDAVAGGYGTSKGEEQASFDIYMASIGLRATEILNLSTAIWGRPEIEGRMLCQTYGIKIHVIEYHHLNGQDVIGHQLVDSSGSRSVEEHSNAYIDPQVIHILNEGSGHFVPILHKTTEPKQVIEKELCTSLSERLQSLSNVTDGLNLHPVRSVASSPKQLSLFASKPERSERGTVMTEIAPLPKNHQAVGSHFVKVFSLTDKSTWSAVAAEKGKADFKILRLTNSPTVSTALEFMQQAEFIDTFNVASHWFFIVIEVDYCSEFPSAALDCLEDVLVKQKPVIIQWDILHSAENLVFFKEGGDSVFTQLHKNTASFFGSENELIEELSKQVSFDLPLIFIALKLGIADQFNGGALDLLNVSFDVEQEIDTWR
jgi:hypothetical protein